jgi:hypothetical protein
MRECILRVLWERWSLGSGSEDLVLGLADGRVHLVTRLEEAAR